MRYADIARIAAELDGRLRGAAVQRAWSPREGHCCLELRVRAGAGWRSAFLTASVEPGVARVGIAAQRPAAAEEPSSFQRWLRQELGGARVAKVGVAPDDRVLRIELEGERGPRTLRAELTGPGGVLALSGDQDRLLSISGAAAPGRHLAPGAP